MKEYNFQEDAIKSYELAIKEIGKTTHCLKRNGRCPICTEKTGCRRDK